MRRLWAFVVAALVAGTVASSAAPEVSARGSGLRWRDCHEEAGPDFECATFAVPLDHDKPSGKKVHLQLVRLPATDQANKQGSIFFNPGGPGGSGVEFLLAVGPFLYSDEVRATFDLVGFDPRGIASSDPLLCFDSFDDALGVLWPFAFPMTKDEERVAKQLDKQLGQACKKNGGAIADHMATADVARDLDLLRRAVGDRELNYVGYSYGSFLGVTYANLFPHRVGALVVDGVLDPIAWTTGRSRLERKTVPFSTRLRSDAGAQATLDEFFRLCDEAGPDGCAFAPDAADRFAALAERLRSEPIEITDPETGEVFLVGYADLIGESLGAMYNSFDWPFFAELLAFVESAADPARPIEPPPRPPRLRPRSRRQGVCGVSARSTRTSSRGSPASPARTASTRTTTASGRRPAPRPTSSSATSVGSGRGRRACARRGSDPTATGTSVRSTVTPPTRCSSSAPGSIRRPGTRAPRSSTSCYPTRPCSPSRVGGTPRCSCRCAPTPPCRTTCSRARLRARDDL